MFSKSLAVLALAGAAQASFEADRVASIPDMAVFDTYPVYSGYLEVNSAKALHYMFIESQNAPSTDPVVIWFNGGPGCSSMLGFAQEHGPYKLDSGTDYWAFNDFSWNREANMLYIESPAGVGFSTCKGVKECNSYSDEESAADNLAAVLAFFAKFPEFGNNDLYISGESYAGIYVPYLANEIDVYNTANADNADVFKPNLKGFMVGNGVTNYDFDCTPAYVEMGYWHSLYNDELRDQIVANNCNFGGHPANPSDVCKTLLSEFNSLVAGVNIYDIFGICYGPEPNPQLQNKTYTAYDYTPFINNPAKSGANMLPPCTFGNPLLDYFHRDDVRAALNIPESVQPWELCTEKISIEYTRGNGSQWVYEALQGKYRMLHYSGDTDGAVPTLGTQGWIATLNWPVTESWRAYTIDN